MLKYKAKWVQINNTQNAENVSMHTKYNNSSMRWGITRSWKRNNKRNNLSHIGMENFSYQVIYFFNFSPNCCLKRKHSFQNLVINRRSKFYEKTQRSLNLSWVFSMRRPERILDRRVHTLASLMYCPPCLFTASTWCWRSPNEL